MRQIIVNDIPFIFRMDDLPLLIHGKERSGASLFSVVAVASLCNNGNLLFFWSAYPMAKDEFYKEIEGKPGIHRIKEVDEIASEEPQIIVMENEASGALSASLSRIDPDRIIFAKNFETLPESLRIELLKRKSLIVAGDVENMLTKDEFLKFRTQVFFSSYLGINMPTLEKYEGLIIRNGNTDASPLIARIDD